MKSLRNTALSALLILAGCGDSALNAPGESSSKPTQDGAADYFPLAGGMAWTYGDRAQVTRVTAVLKTNPAVYVVDDMGKTLHLVKQEDGKVLKQRNGKTRLLYDLGAPEGASWKVEAADKEGADLMDDATVTVVSRSETVKVPYGTFEKAVHLAVRPRPGLFDAGITDLWFVDGIGLVKRSELWIGGVRDLALTAYEAPGVAKAEKAVGVGQELTVELESNATTGYQWQLDGPLDETILKLVGSRYEGAQAGLVGAGGKEVWTFQAVAEGRTTISLKYVRPWEKEPAKTQTFEVVVR